MKRIFVVDDERHAIDRISLIVKRELGAEFDLVGHALSGRSAIEKTGPANPDIVLMDVLMPGISGLDAIREIRKRGSKCVFILVTAYERFEIAKEALELGVVDYLLKPVEKDKLAQSLRAAAAFLDRRSELDRQEVEHRDNEARMRLFVEPAFLHGIMLGEQFGADLGRYLAALDLVEPLAVAAAVAVLPPPGALDPDAQAQVLHSRLRATIRYKTRAMAGPLVAGHALVLLPLRDEASAAAAVASLRAAIAQAHGDDLAQGYLRLGFGGPKPIAKASASWAEALGDLLGSRRSVAATWSADGDRPFEPDEAFLEALADGAPERARFALEQLLEPLRRNLEASTAERYRLATVFGSAYRRMARRGLIPAEEAFALLDFEDFRTAAGGSGLDLAVRARFSKLLDVMERTPRWSPSVARAIAFIKANYGSQISLEQAAAAVGISPNRLSRLFSEETGKGFSDYLIEYRIEKAKGLLMALGASIKQVSMSCGYPDPNYFSRLFKKVTGLTPTAFSSGGTEVADGR
jgi:two-component system response regulator YesN